MYIRKAENVRDFEAVCRLTRCSAEYSKPGIIIRPICDEFELDDVYRLTHDAYVEQQYIQPRPDGRLIHYPHLDNIPETTVLVAIMDGIIVGTNSLTLDGSNGLPVDDDFKKECDQIRREGRALASSWRIATRGGYREEHRIAMGLVQETVRTIINLGVRTCVFALNPKHERSYKRLLNVDTVARQEDSVEGLSNAPAVFMRCDVENLPIWFYDLKTARLQAGNINRAPHDVLRKSGQLLGVPA